MTKKSVSVPGGTHDFSPEQVAKRNFIFNTIKSVFEKYGYQPIETPAMENLSTLTGKYGEEGDKLLFRILNSGPVLDEVRSKKSEVSISDLTEKGLRYDLTVPFARYVVQHQNEIIFPFKRYQIQPVWRADRPQKGRYREFWQCDADVIGSDSLLNEVELIQMSDEVFRKLEIINYKLGINNRKILSGIAEIINEKNKIIDITIAIDKLDKIGIEGVNKELKEKNVSENAITKLQPLILFKGNTQEKILLLKNLLKDSKIGKQGVEDIETVFQLASSIQHPTSNILFDISLARGLDYYTGTIIEVKANNVNIGSIGGGGRYDDLTGIFGLPNVSGVGISFGVDRIYDAMEELGLFEKLKVAQSVTKVLFVNFGGEEEKSAMQMIKKIRDAGINSEMYPDAAKLKKQFDYANKKGIPFVAVIGEEERKKGAITLKDMATGAQESLTIEQIIERLY